MQSYVEKQDAFGHYRLVCFNSTEEAYDACQCDETITDGDVIVVASECVVGLAWTWPVAITQDYGSFHLVKNKISTLENDGKQVFSSVQIDRAFFTAYELGFPVRSCR